jgi:ribosomal protein L44E
MMTDEERKARAKAYKQSFKPAPDVEINCKCPRCETKHTIMDRPPVPSKTLRVYCKTCKTFADNCDDSEVYSFGAQYRNPGNMPDSGR